MINGISQQGAWPRERINELIQLDTPLNSRWNRFRFLVPKLADDEQVPFGTRYDVLRILGCSPWEAGGGRLQKYLAEGTNDVQSPHATEALISALKYLKGTNRELALDGLLRDADRAAALLDAAERGEVTVEDLGARRIKALREHGDGDIRKRTEELFAE
jgi:hypothetical protein